MGITQVLELLGRVPVLERTCSVRANVTANEGEILTTGLWTLQVRVARLRNLII